VAKLSARPSAAQHSEASTIPEQAEEGEAAMSRRVLLTASVLAGSLFLLAGLVPQTSTLMSAEPPGAQAAAKKAPPIQIETLGMPTSPAEVKILKALAESTELNFVEEPLQGVVNHFSDRHNIEILIDRRALEDLNIGTDQPITRELSGISLRSALDLVLRDLDLTWTVDSEVLLVTTPDGADLLSVTKTYDVGDLVVCKDEDGQLYEDYDPLIDTIVNTVAPDSWEERSAGPGSIEGSTFGFAKVLAVHQTCQVHLDVARLLVAIRAMPTESTGMPADKAEAKILKALVEPTEIAFVGEPLQSVVDYLSDRHKIEILIDRRALEDLSIATDEPVTFKVSGISLRSALDLVLRDFDLTWAIDSEVLLITTRDMADECLPVKVYDVSGLVTYRDQDGRTWHDCDELINTIFSTVPPDSWEEIIGCPSDIVVETFGDASVLVVRQTWQVQLEIAQLLSTLRRISKTHAADDRPPVRKRPEVVPGEAFQGISDEECGGKGAIGFMGIGLGGGIDPPSASGPAPDATERSPESPFD
jgi:hypothetical protein